jgi:hypothetical protein
MNRCDNAAFRLACENGHTEIALLLSSLDSNLELTVINNKIINWSINIRPKNAKNINSNLIEMCAICLEKRSNILTSCNHQLCIDCLQHTYTIDICFMCRQNIDEYFLISELETET